MYDYAIVGGGIVGLATAASLLRLRPGSRLVVLEKEVNLAAHQTGRNSGVIHSGIYYAPGSFKARLARDGNSSMVEFCREHGIAHEVCGKLIVASDSGEVGQLQRLYERAGRNGLKASLLSREEVREREPHVECVGAIWVPSTGIVNYRSVCEKLVDLIRESGGEFMADTLFESVRSQNGGQILETSRGIYAVRYLINCAGLQSDRVAKRAGSKIKTRIVPFRGEYYELVPEKRHLIRGLVYPVPDPEFPFLGVHLTRMIDGSVHAGPSAVLAFAREGYRRTDFNLRDLYETVSFPGFWKMAARHLKAGLSEMHRSWSKAAFTKSVQRLVPEINEADLVPAPSGVRAQALMPDGNMVDDFLVVNGERSIHVCNAPSPAATASLEIGRMISGLVSGN